MTVFVGSIASAIAVTQGGGGASMTLPYVANADENPGGVGDYLLIFSGWGNNAAAAPTGPVAAGFTLLGSVSGGGGTFGAEDEGPRGVTAWGKVSSGSESGSITVTNGGASGQSIRSQMYRMYNTGTAWAAPAVVSDDETTAANPFALAAGSNPGSQAGDLIMVGAAWVPAANAASGGTGSAITWTGAGVGATTQGGTGSAVNGTNVRLNSYYANTSQVASGNPGFSITLGGTGLGTGAGLFVRLRDTGVELRAYFGEGQTVEPLDFITISGNESTGNITSSSITQLTGTTVTLAGTGLSRTFTAPASLAGEVLTFRLTIGDGSTTSTSDVSVEIMAAAEVIDTGGGVDVPLVWYIEE